MARRRSGQNFDELSNGKEYPGLSRQEVSEIMSMFKRTEQKSGAGISLYDLVCLLRNMSYDIDEARKSLISAELQQKEIRLIDLNTTLHFAAQIKKEKEDARYTNEDQNNEYIDAFVALGGSPDASGHVSKANLMHILKSEFELFVDLESLLNLGGESDDHLYFNQFKELFDQEIEPTNRNSVLSLISKRGDEPSLGTMKVLEVDPKEFEKYLSRLEAGSSS